MLKPFYGGGIYQYYQSLVDIESIPQGIYLLEIEDLASGQKILRRVVIGN